METQSIPFEVRQEAVKHANTVAPCSEEAWHKAYQDYLQQYLQKQGS